MGLDPTLVRGFNPNPNIGPDVAGALQNAQQLWNLDAQQKQAQSVNALKGILSQPGALDANGNPTADALGRITAVDPMLGIKFRQNALVDQQKQLQQQMLGSKLFQQKTQIMADAYGPIGLHYEDNIKAGMPPQQAMEAANKELADANQQLAAGGLYSTEEQQRHPTQFDPVKFQQFMAGSDAVLNINKQRMDAAKEARQEAHQQTEEDRGRFDKPESVTYKDKNGQEVRTEAVWDKNTLKWVDANTHQVIDAAVTKYKEPAAGSIAEQRNAINEELANDPDWKDKPAGERAREAENRLAIAGGKIATPEGRHATAEMIASYQIPPLSGWAMTRPGGAETMEEVRKINPNYEAPRFGEVNKVMQAFGTGKQGDIVRSLNTAVQHLDVMDQAGKALRNGDVQLFNRLGNRINAEMGYEAPTTFDGLKQIVGTEIEKAVAGGIGAEADRERLMRALSGANSPEQMQGVIDGFKNLMAGQVNSLKIQYEDGTGFTDKSAFPFEKKLAPETAALLGRLNASKRDKPDTTPAKKDEAAQVAQAGPPDEAVNELRKNADNPKYIASFDKHFGDGAAAKALGGAAKEAPKPQPAAAPPVKAGGFQDGQTATNPKTGQKVIFKNGQWVPLTSTGPAA